MFNDDILWAQELVRARAEDVRQRLENYCAKPKSAARLHRTRKALARLRSAIEDTGEDAHVDVAFYANVRALHRAAGKVRDADVLIDRVQSYAREGSVQERSQAARVIGALRKIRKKARRKLRRLIRRTPRIAL